MCIGLPMTVVTAEPGHAVCAWRGEARRVDTALVGQVRPGDRLLVFMHSARERLDAERAAEIDATLELLALAGIGGSADASPDAAFPLPSAMSADHLAQLVGRADPAAPPLPIPV